MDPDEASHHLRHRWNARRPRRAHPYDFAKVQQDTLKHATAEMVSVFAQAGYAIILFSGRDDSCQDMTTAWLTANDMPFDELVMRPTGDRRKDSTVKSEMYERTVRGTYAVFLVLDDRDQVVDMWRQELGLPCFRVDYGNF
jgi:hypothetical protein